MEKYLYLSEVEMIDAWINGGEIPISLASKYVSPQRDGVNTPDENIIHDSPVDIKRIFPWADVKNGNSSFKNVTFTECHDVYGQPVPDTGSVSYYKEDGLIISLCNSFCRDIAFGLGKKKACVKIINVDKLRKVVGKQLGVKGIMKGCEYTDDHQRNHFLKATEDSWQDEYRIFWKYPKRKLVKIPKGIAEFVSTFEY